MKIKTSVKVLCVVAVIIIAAGTISYVLSKTRVKAANEAEGRFLLQNVAIAEQTYSATHGGGGETNFTGNIDDLSQYASNKMVGAVRCPGKKETAWGGYYMVISEKVQGDAFKNDYIATVYPAKGYFGKTMQISKDEKIIIVGEQK